MANESIKIETLDYNPGDKRSYGSLLVVAETPIGTVQISGNIDSGSEFDLKPSECSLNGIQIPSSFWNWEGSPVIDPGLPHYLASKRLKSRVNEKEQVTEMLVEFVEMYQKFTAESVK